MIKKTRTDWIHILLIIGCVLFAVEFIFINTGLLFVIILASIAIYFGRRSFHKTSGKTIFWGGAFFLFITVINTMAVRFVLLAVILYIVWNWYKTKQQPKEYQVEVPVNVEQPAQEGKIIRNKWFGKYDNSDRPYVWEDINIQSFVSDITIDLNNTMLPKNESIMIVRQLIGNVQIIVPYDVEISIDHSVLYGEINIFDHQQDNAFNRNIHLRTEGYSTSPQKVKIVSQVLIGKLEVKRG